MNGGPIQSVFPLADGAVAFVLLIACAIRREHCCWALPTIAEDFGPRPSAPRAGDRRQLLVESVLLRYQRRARARAVAIGIRLFDAATQDVGKPVYSFDMPRVRVPRGHRLARA